MTNRLMSTLTAGCLALSLIPISASACDEASWMTGKCSWTVGDYAPAAQPNDHLKWWLVLYTAGHISFVKGPYDHIGQCVNSPEMDAMITLPGITCVIDWEWNPPRLGELGEPPPNLIIRRIVGFRKSDWAPPSPFGAGQIYPFDLFGVCEPSRLPSMKQHGVPRTHRSDFAASRSEARAPMPA